MMILIRFYPRNRFGGALLHHDNIHLCRRELSCSIIYHPVYGTARRGLSKTTRPMDGLFSYNNNIIVCGFVPQVLAISLLYAGTYATCCKHNDFGVKVSIHYVLQRASSLKNRERKKIFPIENRCHNQ